MSSANFFPAYRASDTWDTVFTISIHMGGLDQTVTDQTKWIEHLIRVYTVYLLSSNSFIHMKRFNLGRVW